MEQNYFIEQFICINALPQSILNENNIYAWVRLPIDPFDDFNQAINHARALPQKELRISNDKQQWKVS